MTNNLLKDAVRFYRTRDVESFNNIKEAILSSKPKSTIVRQLNRMSLGILTPLNNIAKPVSEEVMQTIRNAPRKIRRRFNSKRFDPNGAHLVDKKASIISKNSEVTKEYNFMHHATKGYKLRSRTLTKVEIMARDSGYSALILPDLTDEDVKARMKTLNTTPPRLALTSENYLKR